MKSASAAAAPASPGIQSKPRDQSGAEGCSPQASMSSPVGPSGVTRASGAGVAGPSGAA
ncbi:hypothetical protein D3C77_189930 [compost metagenome]